MSHLPHPQSSTRTRAPLSPAGTGGRGIPSLLAVASLALAGCGPTVLVRATSPVGTPGPGGATTYAVGRLAFEVPASWQASGDARRISAAHPEGRGRLDVPVVGVAKSGWTAFAVTVTASVVAPNCSVTFTVRASSTSKVILSSYFLNAESATVTVYSPGPREAKA